MSRYLIVALISLLSGCVDPTVMQARRLLERGELEEALIASRGNHAALRTIALHIIVEGLSYDQTREPATRGLRVADRSARAHLRRLTRETRDELTWALAAEARANLGSHAMRRQLQSRLVHPDPDVRAVALRALTPEVRQIELYDEFLADPHPTVRLAAVTALGERAELTGAGAGLTRTILHDPDPIVRAAAMRALPRIERGEMLLEAARTALADETGSPELRLAAIDALGRTDRINEAETLLLRQLDAANAAERLRAASIIAAYGNERGHDFLRAALDSPDADVVRGAALWAGQVGGPLVRPLLLAMRRPEPEVRLQASTSLLRLGEEEVAVVELSRLLSRPGWIGLQAALALARHPETEGPAALRLAAALSDESPQIRAYTALSLGFLDLGLELVASAMADPEPTVRVAAATALLRSLERDRRTRLHAGHRGP